ncbi:DCN1-like protein 5 [Vitis vinifera]|uniref:Defective in cullin neddylation protein n=1 Tax=Vitis vinifera TaxID=29760 RepID=A0A438DJL7_VITVI|nr:DCN1-like protein 5 [Vitis vinifera]
MRRSSTRKTGQSNSAASVNSSATDLFRSGCLSFEMISKEMEGISGRIVSSSKATSKELERIDQLFYSYANRSSNLIEHPSWARNVSLMVSSFKHQLLIDSEFHDVLWPNHVWKIDKRYIFIFLEHCFALCCALVALKMKGKFLKVGCKGVMEWLGDLERAVDLNCFLMRYWGYMLDPTLDVGNSMVVSDLNGEFWAVNETTTWKSNLGWVRLLVIVLELFRKGNEWFSQQQRVGCKIAYSWGLVVQMVGCCCSPEGIEVLCSDVEVDHTDVRILMLAWKMKAEKQGYFTLERGCKIPCKTILVGALNSPGSPASEDYLKTLATSDGLGVQTRPLCYHLDSKLKSVLDIEEFLKLSRSQKYSYWEKSLVNGGDVLPSIHVHFTVLWEDQKATSNVEPCHMGSGRSVGHWPGWQIEEEWRRGLKALRTDTVSKLKKALPELEKEVRRPSNFVDFYSYAFRYCLTVFSLRGETKSIDIESICELLDLVLGSQFQAQVDSFVEYLKTQNDYKVINMDQWMGFFRFCNEISFPDLRNYDPELAWPLILDNFVEWRRAKHS